MSARPDCHALPVNHRCHIMGMGALHGERYDRTFVFGFSKNTEGVDL